MSVLEEVNKHIERIIEQTRICKEETYKLLRGIPRSKLTHPCSIFDKEVVNKVLENRKIYSLERRMPYDTIPDIFISYHLRKEDAEIAKLKYKEEKKVDDDYNDPCYHDLFTLDLDKEVIIIEYKTEEDIPYLIEREYNNSLDSISSIAYIPKDIQKIIFNFTIEKKFYVLKDPVDFMGYHIPHIVKISYYKDCLEDLIINDDLGRRRVRGTYKMEIEEINA